MIDPSDVGGPPSPRPVEPTRPPAVPSARPAWFYPLLAGCAVVLTGVAIFLAVQYYRPGPGTVPPAPVVDGVTLGRNFRQPLADALADGFDAGADALEKGRPVSEADVTLKDVFHGARAAAFARLAGSTFDSVVPGKSEPKDDANRKAFARLHRDFARGLRGK